MRYFKLGEVPSSLYPIIGGKAKGLDFLVKNGFNVPKGFILTDLENLKEGDYDILLSYFKELNVKEVSVRSSAKSEDGVNFSSAGQYETCLNVNETNFIESIKICLDSLNSDRVKAYSDSFQNENESKMNIVVQEMIDSSFAGVMFTCDPMNNENVLIEIVEGQGENLVSGNKESERLSINKENLNFINNSKVKDEVINKILKEGLNISNIYKTEADLEFAIDSNNSLYWLQLRPITASAEEANIDEFNPNNDLNNHLLTTRNIGEMMPGAVTPLSISTSVLAIDYGIRNMLRVIGHIKKVSDKPDYYCALAIKNHLFIDLTSLHGMTKSVIGTSSEAMNLSILGEYLEDYPKPKGKNRNIFIKLINGIKFGKYLFSSKKSKKYIVNLENNLTFDKNDSIKEIYDEISSKLHAMNIALSCHYVCSSFSGAMNSALYMTLSPLFENKAEYQAFVSNLLLNIDGIESANILNSLKEIADIIVKENSNAKYLTNEELLNLVCDENNVEVNKLYKQFIKRHGHRSIKEAELRSSSWKNNPLMLMQNLHTVILSNKNEEIKKEFNLDEYIKDFKNKKAIKWICKNARQAVIDREFSKSIIIKVIDKFKDRYILLAKLLKEEGYLADTDSIYFLTNEEIGKLIDGDISLKKKAIARRNKYKESENLRFDDIVIGEPKPIDTITLSEEKTLYGIPVCKGKVYGRVRVVHNQEEANQLQQDEIMIAPFTDIGWSPYYSLISALITEVGSALSHGAVVAREYSLPTIVNVKNATFNIKTGDYAYVNADNGSITVITKEEYDLIKGE